MSALIVMVVALYFTDLVAEIPSAALAGLVANAIVSIIDVRAFRKFARVRRSEFLIALGCTAGVLVLGPIGGLVLAVVATMVDMVRRVAGSPWVTLEPPEGDWEMERFAAVAHPDTPPSDLDDVSFVRLAGPLFFANADTLRDRIEAAAAERRPMDAARLRVGHRRRPDRQRGPRRLGDDAPRERPGARRRPRIGAVQDLLERLRHHRGIGDDHLYATNRAALAAYLDHVGAGDGTPH